MFTCFPPFSEQNWYWKNAKIRKLICILDNSTLNAKMCIAAHTARSVIHICAFLFSEEPCFAIHPSPMIIIIGLA